MEIYVGEMESFSISDRFAELLRRVMKSQDPFTVKIKPSIYIVPASVKILNRRAYSPQTVSFGPYHHGAHHLMSMEIHKERALHLFLTRRGKSPNSLIQHLREVLPLLKESYDPLEEVWRNDDDKFLMLMMLDGCFMMEIIFFMNHSDHYSSNDIYDTVFSYHGKMNTIPYILRDMLFLENQLPMLLLEKLAAFGGRTDQDKMSLQRLITHGWPCWMISNHSFSSSLHILDLYRKTLLHTSQPPERLNRGVIGDKFGSIPSAIGLSQAGLSFRRSKTDSLKDISFNRAVIELPRLVVDDELEGKVLNMMAFERLHVGTGNEVTSYVFFFMACIVNTEGDVALLRSKGIIEHMMGSDRAVARLFNYLSKDANFDAESDLGVTYARINGYCNRPWSKWRAGIIQTVNYFQSTWAFLTLIAALVYFALTVAQTWYTVLSFYK